MTPPHVQIANLLGRYAEAIDAGDLVGASRLFSRARVRADVRPDVEPLDADGVLELWRNFIVLHDDGTPRTKHVITNLIIDVDEPAGTATCRSTYTVHQATDGFPLQVIIAGRYHDEFARSGDEWHFTYRDYTLVDLVGDMSRHAKQPLP